MPVTPALHEAVTAAAAAAGISISEWMRRAALERLAVTIRDAMRISLR